MRRFQLPCAILLTLVILVGGAAIIAIVVLDVDLNLPESINLPWQQTSPGILPTHTPAPVALEVTPQNTPAPPPSITSSDGCRAVASAAGLTVDAETQREEFLAEKLPQIQTLPESVPENVAPPGKIFNRYIIQFTPDSVESDRNQYIRSIRARSRRKINSINTYVIFLRPRDDTGNFPESPIVLNIEPDFQAVASQADSPPNDPYYEQQWSLPVMGVAESWRAVREDALPVIVAVVDSGVCQTHPDLEGRMVEGYDFVDYDTDPEDVFGHGCGVAGVIAANRNNGTGIAGIAPNARIMPLRVLDERGLGSYSDIAAAIVFAVDNGAQIINLSLAGPTYSDALLDAVNYAAAEGVMVVAAAGNFGSPNPYFPAAFPSVIGVGSVDPALNRSSFSNFGNWVSVQAPGRDIITTNIAGGYETMTGTSFAAPQVAGIAALTREFNVPLNTDGGIVFVYPPDASLDCNPDTGEE